MQNYFTKVDGVSTVNEALKLQALNVDIITVSIDNSDKSDMLLVSIEEAKKIGNCLNSTKLSVSFEDNFKLDDIIAVSKLIKLDYVQIPYNRLINDFFIEQLDEKNIGIIFSGIALSYDDRIEWILNKERIDKNVKTFFYQIDLLGDIQDAWSFLKNETINYPDEIQISSINQFALENPIFISIDFKMSNIEDILKNIESVRGIYLTLLKVNHRNDIHYFSLDEICNLIKFTKSIY